MEQHPDTAFFHKTRLLSFLAAVSVVYIHAENWAQFGFSEGTNAYALEWRIIGLMAWAVPYFFMLSAFLFYRNFTWNVLLQKWRRRIPSLLVPYLAWNTIYFLLFAVLPRIPAIAAAINAAPAELTISSVLSGILLHTYDGMMWYLRILILLTLAAPVFYTVLRVRFLGPAVVATLFALMIARVPFPLPIAYMNWQNLFYYAFGALAALRFPKLPIKEIPKPLRTAARFFIPIALLYQYLIGTGLYPFLMSLLLFCAISGNGKERPAYSASFFLYGSHMLVLSFIKKIQFALVPHTPVFMLASYLTAPMIAVAVILPTALLVKKYAPVPWRVLTGNR